MPLTSINRKNFFFSVMYDLSPSSLRFSNFSLESALAWSKVRWFDV